MALDLDIRERGRKGYCLAARHFGRVKLVGQHVRLREIDVGRRKLAPGRKRLENSHGFRCAGVRGSPVGIDPVEYCEPPQRLTLLVRRSSATAPERLPARQSRQRSDPSSSIRVRAGLRVMHDARGGGAAFHPHATRSHPRSTPGACRFRYR